MSNLCYKGIVNRKMCGLIWMPSEADLIAERKFIEAELEDLGEGVIHQLIKTAIKFRSKAYTPYSHYNVGAALLTTSGEIVGGSNSESAAYSPTNHAEGTAIAKANSEGLANKNRKYIKAIAICHQGDTGPCGECLQRIVEHTDNCLIIVADPKGKIKRITSLKAIFPYNFNPSHLRDIK